MLRTTLRNQSPLHAVGSAKSLGLLLNLPAIVVLLLWSVVPLAMTLWFSFERYNLMSPDRKGFDHLGNYRYLFTDPGLPVAIWNTVLLRHLDRHPARSGLLRPERGSSAGFGPILCHAYGQRSRLEKYAAQSRQRSACLPDAAASS